MKPLKCRPLWGKARGKELWTVALFALAGLLLVAFLGNTKSAREWAALEKSLYLEQSQNDYLQGRQAALQAAVDDARQSRAARDANGAKYAALLEEARQVAGLTQMQGEGVEVTLQDAPRQNLIEGVDLSFFIVHDEDLLYLVNALRAAGAKGISINGERILGDSPILCRGPSIYISRLSFIPPYEVLAIGDQETLLAAAREAQFRYLGIVYTAKGRDLVLLPAGKEKKKYAYANATHKEGT